VTFRLSYEVGLDQHVLHGQGTTAARVVTIEADIEPASDTELNIACQAWLTAVTGEREALHRETRGDLPPT
jgi:hypothetical protein